MTVILDYFVAKSISNSYFCKKFRYSFSRFIVSLIFIFILWGLLSQLWQNEMVFTFNEKGGSSHEILHLRIPLDYSGVCKVALDLCCFSNLPENYQTKNIIIYYIYIYIYIYICTK